MNPTVLEVEQGSVEWLEARLGLATASRFKDILAKTQKGEYKKTRSDYLYELASERYGVVVDRYTSRDMEIGSETEDLARVEYELATGNIVDECGFFIHPTLKAGASPDGLIGDEGLLEIKCRKIANHFGTLHSGEVPEDFMAQIQGQLWITERKWCDFVSFVPELPKNAQLFIKRVPRDDAYILELIHEVELFLREVESEVEFVKEYGNE